MGQSQPDTRRQGQQQLQCPAPPMLLHFMFKQTLSLGKFTSPFVDRSQIGLLRQHGEAGLGPSSSAVLLCALSYTLQEGNFVATGYSECRSLRLPLSFVLC